MVGAKVGEYLIIFRGGVRTLCGLGVFGAFVGLCVGLSVLTTVGALDKRFPLLRLIAE
jgi:hypothetical protein